MTTTPLTAGQSAEIIQRHHLILDPNACGTCRQAVASDRPVEHTECRRRATLTTPVDAPDYEDLVELTDEERAALPPRFHTPAWEGNATPTAWLCAVCWDDGWVTRWPCATAAEHGADVFTPERSGDTVARDLDTLLGEVKRLAAENGRLRTAWHSARHRANHNHLAGQRFPGGAVREALVHAGYINRRDTVASAVEKINDAPRKWYVRWLVDRLQRSTCAHMATVKQAKQQARRAEQAEAELGRVRAERDAAMDPLTARWDRTVIHPDNPAEDTIVCCLTDDGQPVALFLDDELREALGLILVDPNPET